MSIRCSETWALISMKYKIVCTRIFEKKLKKLTAVEQRQVAVKLKILQNDPFFPSLRTKKLKGFDDLSLVDNLFK